jgi:Bardet-Biedl syndrome 1 protein
MECPHIPVFINAGGLYDVEYRILAACRDGTIYVFKRGFKTPKATIALSSQIVGIERNGKNMMVGCMDKSLNCYSTKGKKLWKLEMPGDILTMVGLDLKSKGLQGVVVSLSNNEVYIYKDKYLISKFSAQDNVVGIKFGKFGREEANLVMTTKSNYFFNQKSYPNK